MQTNDVITWDDFHLFIKDLVDAKGLHNPKPLEEYLRGLYAAVEAYGQLAPSLALFAHLLETAFSIEPSTVTQEWFEAAPPDFDSIADSGYEALLTVLRFQVADLWRMAQAGILNQSPANLYYGIQSPSGHTWYNFTPASFLECGSATLQGEDSDCRWLDLAYVLWMGQNYE